MKKITLSFFLFAALGTASPVQVSFANPGTPGVVDKRSNDYVGPYGLTVDGQSVPAMCMNDYNFVSGSWDAALTPVNASDLSQAYLGNNTYNVGGHSFSSAQVYAGEAYLFSQLIQPNSNRIDLQDAAWTIMDYVTGHTPHTTDQAIMNIISDVAAHAGTFDTSHYEILSEVSPGAHPEQEFIVPTPEPSTLLLLGSALCLLGLSRFRGAQRQQAK